MLCVVTHHYRQSTRLLLRGSVDTLPDRQWETFNSFLTYQHLLHCLLRLVRTYVAMNPPVFTLSCSSCLDFSFCIRILQYFLMCPFFLQLKHTRSVTLFVCPAWDLLFAFTSDFTFILIAARALFSGSSQERWFSSFINRS